MPQTAVPILDIFASVTDPRRPSKVQHPLPDLLTVAVCGVLVGTDTFEEIELWAKEKLSWLRQYLSLPNGVPSHDTFARLFGLMDPHEFEAAFRRWVEGILPSVSPQVVALDGKTSRRSAKACARRKPTILRPKRHPWPAGWSPRLSQERRSQPDRRRSSWRVSASPTYEGTPREPRKPAPRLPGCGTNYPIH